ncbi:holin [Paenibacillus sp. J2TS4]|uniref:holin n=1 Tax=Paenibacillus sp. J2TS4 TaxID=2807194 RepID=UPI001B2F4E0C|nr:holin [Paenibacillus sp. J2TS4]GIP35524.1 hypothetical protein J2TS4_47340 [Paenibacillus sp. J2TS4]
MLGKKRWRNYGLWAALIALVTDILIYAGLISFTQEEVEFVTQRILEILVLLGILNNPTSPAGKGFNL